MTDYGEYGGDLYCTRCKESGHKTYGCPRPEGFMPGAPIDCGPGTPGPAREYVCVASVREITREEILRGAGNGSR